MDLDKIYTYMEKRRYDLAEKSLQELLDAGAEKEAQELLVSLYIECSEREKAEHALQALLHIAPREAYTLFLQARVHFMKGCSLSVVKELELALKGKNMQSAVKEKIYNLLGQCCRYFGNSRKSTECYLQAAKTAESTEMAALEYSNYLFNLHYLDEPEDEQSLAVSQHYNDFFQRVPSFIHRRREYPGQKIRIGYLSPDLRNHVVLRFSFALLKYYDHDSFEVYCYTRGAQDEMSAAVAKLVDQWRDLSAYSAGEAARCIYEDQIDILFDLSGHTRDGCLPILAYRPAPVQLSGIGYFATTGLSAVDYFLGDRYLDRGTEENESQIISSPAFSEKLLLLPHSHFCYTPLCKADVSAGAPCKKKGYISYGCFNNFTKVTDELLVIWQQIIRSVPHSRLLLKAEIFHTQEGRQLVKKRLLQAGFDLQQVEMRGTSLDYLHEYNDIDIALDTYPYPGGGTTCDALYMGVPVISLKGDSHGRRFGYSILMNAGFGELAASDWQEYVDKAVKLASDFDLLDLLHKNMRGMLERSLLMDAHGYMAEVEAAYQKIWKLYVEHQMVPEQDELVAYMPRLQTLAEQEDWQQAMALADFLLAAEPKDFSIVKKLSEIYLDGRDLPAVRKVLDFLQNTQEKGYVCFIQAELSFLEGRWEESETYAKHALQQGKLGLSQRGMVHNLLAQLYKHMGRQRQSAEEYLNSSECKQQREQKCIEYSNYLMGLHYFTGKTEECLAAAQGYAKLFAGVRPVPIAGIQTRKLHKRLRVGYVSGDFCQHVAAFFSLPFFEQYDAAVFQVYGYSFTAPNAMSERMAATADVWREMAGWSFAEAARRIAADEIDVLVDLSGHTGTSCLPLFVYRPAPVQISGVGYFDTTGLTQMDYFLADRHTIPGEEAIVDGMPFGFVERLLRLPQSHLCYTSQPGAPVPAPASCLQNGRITFGCFNNFTKVTDELLELWSHILKKVPGARLLLKAKAFDDSADRNYAKKRLCSAGIEEERVCMEGYSEDYLQSYHQVDIALDTYPYPGGGTTCDALYMGVPVITRVGKSHHERFGYSILKNTGLEELAAFSAEEYVEKAVGLAKNPARLAGLHQQLRRRLQQSPVMDAAGYMFEVEQLYMKCWNLWYWSERIEEHKSAVQQEVKELQQAFQLRQWEKVHYFSRGLSGKGVTTRYIWTALAVADYYQQDYERAALAARQALQLGGAAGCLSPVDLYFILGNALRFISRATEAQEAFVHAWQLFQQGEASVDEGISYKLLAAIALGNFRLGNTAEALNGYYAAYQAVGELEQRCEMYSSWLFTFHHGKTDAVKLLQNHIGYRALFAGIRPYTRHCHAGKKLRIGYVSGDFREHVMYSFLFWLLAGYDHEKFRVYCYNMAAPQAADAYTALLRPMVDGWRELAGQPYEAAARIIYEDQIDILFDLSGHSAGSGLPIFAWRPAPVQVSGLGYMDTTGLDTVDYFLADKYTIPEGMDAERFFTEKIIRLPSQFCYFGTELPASQAAPCQHNGSILFGVFNHYRKITDEMLAAWCDILRQVPGSRLLLKSQIFVNLCVQDKAYARMSAMGFDMNRVCFEPATRDYMYRYLDVDIALDTYPYPGGGTTCDALYMGVPVITCYGKRHGSRFGYSILNSVGLGELAAPDVSAYIERAVALAGDHELLESLHRNLRKMMKKSILMDGQAYMKGLEKLYQRIWHEYEE